MHFSPCLYTGSYAEKYKDQIIRGLKAEKRMPSVFVITEPVDSDGIMDIFHCHALYKDYYREKDPLVIGIAMSKSESYETARRIVDDMYRQNGAFDLHAFRTTGNT